MTAAVSAARVGTAQVAGAAVLWSLIGVCSAELVDLGMPARQVAVWRALLGGACFVVHLAVRGRLRRTRAPGGPRDGLTGAWVALRGHAGPLAVFTLVGVVVFYSTLPLAVDAGGIALAYVLLYTAPVWVALGAVVLLGEHLGPVRAGAIAVTVLGVAALALGAGGTVTVSVASVSWGLLAGLSYSSYYLSGRRLFEAVEPVLVYAVALPVGGLALAVVVGLDRPTAAMLGWLVLLGVASTWLAWFLFALGVRRVESTRAVVVAMVEPVLATMIGVAFYGERLGALGVAGALAVVGASTLVAVRTEA